MLLYLFVLLKSVFLTLQVLLHITVKFIFRYCLSTAILNECNKDLIVCKNFVDPQMHHVFSASRNKI